VALTPGIFLDVMGLTIDRQAALQAYDLKVSFRQPRSDDVVGEITGWPGVTTAEGIIEFPVRLRVAGREATTFLLGLPADGRLLALETRPRPETILLARGLAQELQARPGAMVTVETPFGAGDFPLEGTVVYPLGRPAVLSLPDAQGVTTLPQGIADLLSASGLGLAGAVADPVTAVLVGVAPGQLEAVRERLYALPAAERVEASATIRADLNELLGFSATFMRVMFGFAAALGFAVLYAITVVNVLERRRELATLRTLGGTTGEVGWVVTGELLAVGLLGLLLGLPLGVVIAEKSLETFQKIFALGVVLLPRTALVIAGATLAILVVSEVPSLVALARLDLAQATRERAT
ncbi:MAG: FtsX-like permease family protein, partial [Deinococcus sp.]|nr:FtsX-like permease family protein [Deinococcus sp.]